jgi:hypothetical protein
MEVWCVPSTTHVPCMQWSQSRVLHNWGLLYFSNSIISKGICQPTTALIKFYFTLHNCPTYVSVTKWPSSGALYARVCTSLHVVHCLPTHAEESPTITLICTFNVLLGVFQWCKGCLYKNNLLTSSKKKACEKRKSKTSQLVATINVNEFYSLFHY